MANTQSDLDADVLFENVADKHEEVEAETLCDGLRDLEA